MKSPKPKKGSKKAPCRLSFTATTNFRNGISIAIFGYKDGSVGIKGTAPGMPVERMLFTSEYVAAFVRTMAQQMISKGAKLEDFV